MQRPVRCQQEKPQDNGPERSPKKRGALRLCRNQRPVKRHGEKSGFDVRRSLHGPCKKATAAPPGSDVQGHDLQAEKKSV